MNDLEIKLKDYLEDKDLKKRLGFQNKVSFNLLARGEYHINYLIFEERSENELKESEKRASEGYVLRINTGSQMHLENQIRYEADALEFLERSQCTPKVFYVDDTRDKIPYGILIMEYLPGKPLDYRSDMKEAAEILSRIHSLDTKECKTILKAGRTASEILAESDAMLRIYEKSRFCDRKLKDHVRSSLDRMMEKYADEKAYEGNLSIINTELNSGNFLINKGKKSYLIDWEKPLLGDPMQDLAHFLSPTTTFWKTDVILEENETEEFLKEYSKRRNVSADDRERLSELIKVTCFRGITWCAMAYTEYMEPGREIKNEDTFRKIKEYLKEDFYRKYIP